MKNAKSMRRIKTKMPAKIKVGNTVQILTGDNKGLLGTVVFLRPRKKIVKVCLAQNSLLAEKAREKLSIQNSEIVYKKKCSTEYIQVIDLDMLRLKELKKKREEAKFIKGIFKGLKMYHKLNEFILPSTNESKSCFTTDCSNVMLFDENVKAPSKTKSIIMDGLKIDFLKKSGLAKGSFKKIFSTT